MSIALNILTPARAGAAQPLPKTGHQTRSASLFEDILANKSQTTAQLTPQRLIELVSLSQLSLAQGWWADADAEPGVLLPELFNETASPLFRQPPEQAVQFYREAQHPLLVPTVAGRETIDSLIDQVAAKHSLAPELVRAVVAAESSYDPRAESPVGAQGLMQLMPATAEELGVADSFDARQNLEGGSRYLKQLLNKYDGDLDHALAAYNWGQGNVDRHGLEQMPAETRTYLARVKAGLDPQSA